MKFLIMYPGKRRIRSYHMKSPFNICVLIISAILLVNPAGGVSQDSTEASSHLILGEMPENTLPFTGKMLHSGMAVVVRPHCTRDGKIIFLREDNVPPAPEGTWIIKARDWGELNGMQAGWWYGGEFKELRIPSAEEIFEAAVRENKSGINFIIDFQEDYPGIGRRLCNLLQHYGLFDRSLWIDVPESVADEIAGSFPGFSKAVVVPDLADSSLRSGSIQGNCILAPIDGYQSISHGQLSTTLHSGKKIIALLRFVPENEEYFAAMAAELKNMGFSDVAVDLPAHDFFPLLQASRREVNREKRRLELIRIGESGEKKDSEKEELERVGNMVKIPAGTFWMGSNSGEGYTNEGPYHPVYLDEYWIDMYEVTIGEFVEFLNAGKHDSYYNPFMRDDKACGIIRNAAGIYEVVPGREHYPVTYVSWEAAGAYARWAGKRLPTEAEWEKAARGTVPGRQYSTAGYVSQSLANYKGRSRRDYWDFTAPVGVFPPNEYMMYDMCGNVWEWMQDYYHPNFYQADTMYNPVNDPQGEHPFKDRMIRGGSWADDNEKDSYLRVSARGPNYPIPQNWAARIGFRCASSTRPAERRQRSSLTTMVDRLRESNPSLYKHLSTDSLRSIILQRDYLLDISYDSGIKSMAKAVAFSAALPGAGEFYTGRWITGAVFLGVEAALWYNVFANHGKAHDIDVYFKDFAARHFDPNRYLNWLSDYRAAHNGADPPNFNPELEINTLIKVEPGGKISYGGRTSQFYIRIAKYDQFLPGWDDHRGEGLQGSSQNRDYYSAIQSYRWRDRDSYEKRVTIYAIAIAGNHLLSVVDTIWGIKRSEIYRSTGWMWDMEIKYISGSPVEFLSAKYKW